MYKLERLKLEDVIRMDFSQTALSQLTTILGIPKSLPDATKYLLERASDPQLRALPLNCILYQNGQTNVVGIHLTTSSMYTNEYISKVNEWYQRLQETERLKPNSTTDLWEEISEEPATHELLKGDIYKIRRVKTFNVATRKFIEKCMLLRLVCTNGATTLERRSTFIVRLPMKADLLVFLDQIHTSIDTRSVTAALRNATTTPSSVRELLTLNAIIKETKEIVPASAVPTIEQIESKAQELVTWVLSQYEPYVDPHRQYKDVQSMYHHLGQQPETWKETAQIPHYKKYDFWVDSTNIISRASEHVPTASVLKLHNVVASSIFKPPKRYIVAKRKETQQQQ